jgi:hypothetical protein
MMLKKSASFVLASLRGSTYRSVRLASLLAAVLLDGFLSIMRDVHLLSIPCGPLGFLGPPWFFRILLFDGGDVRRRFYGHVETGA